MRDACRGRAQRQDVDRSEPLVNVFDDLSDIEDSSDDEEFEEAMRRLLRSRVQPRTLAGSVVSSDSESD